MFGLPKIELTMKSCDCFCERFLDIQCQQCFIKKFRNFAKIAENVQENFSKGYLFTTVWQLKKSEKFCFGP